MPSQFTEQTWPRPLLALTLAFVLALVIERIGPYPPTGGLLPVVILTTVVLLAALWILLWVKAPVRWPILPLLLFFLLGLLAHRVTAPPVSTVTSVEAFLNKSSTLFVAEVMTTPDPQPDKTRLFLHLLGAYSSPGGVPLDTGVILTVRNCRGLWLPGQLLLARLQLKRIHGFRNPGAYDYERAQAERGFFVSAFLPDDGTLIPLSATPPFLEEARRYGSSWPGVVARFRLDALDWLKTQLPPDTAAIYAALLLGFQNQVPRDVQEHWNRAGVTHLLSISGQHLGMVAMATFWLLRTLFRLRTTLLERWSDQRLALWWAVLLALLYAAVGGLSLPTWRSAIMLSLFFAGIAWGRPTDFASALSLAALLMLLLETYALWTASFQLTFAAMTGIFLVYPRLWPMRSWLRRALQRAADLIPRTPTEDRPIHESPSRWRWLAPFADAFWVSLAANLMVLPLVIHHFHGISLVGLVANTILVPLTGFLVLPLGLLSLALFAVNQTPANWVLVPAGCVGTTQRIAHRILQSSFLGLSLGGGSGNSFLGSHLWHSGDHVEYLAVAKQRDAGGGDGSDHRHHHLGAFLVSTGPAGTDNGASGAGTGWRVTCRSCSSMLVKAAPHCWRAPTAARSWSMGADFMTTPSTSAAMSWHPYCGILVSRRWMR